MHKHAASPDIKKACDALATYHRDAHEPVTVMRSRDTGINIYVVSDAHLKENIEKLLEPVLSGAMEERVK